MTIEPRSLTDKEFLYHANTMELLPKNWQDDAKRRLANLLYPPPAEGSVQALQQLELFP
jgi:hypothetical protein